MTDDSDLHLPEDGTGQLYGPDGEPAPSPAERETQKEEPDAPTVTCAYCERDFEKIRDPHPLRSGWILPEGVRKLPNSLYECEDCRPVLDLETGRMVRPDPEHRG